MDMGAFKLVVGIIIFVAVVAALMLAYSFMFNGFLNLPIPSPFTSFPNAA